MAVRWLRGLKSELVQDLQSSRQSQSHQQNQTPTKTKPTNTNKTKQHKTKPQNRGVTGASSWANSCKRWLASEKSKLKSSLDPDVDVFGVQAFTFIQEMATDVGVWRASLSRAGWWFRMRRPFSSGRMVGWKILTLLLNWTPDHPCFPWLRLLDDGRGPQPVVLWRHQALQISHSRGFVVDRYNSCGTFVRQPLLPTRSTPQRRVSACCQDMDCATQTSSQLNPNIITTLLSLRLNAKYPSHSLCHLIMVQPQRLP